MEFDFVFIYLKVFYFLRLPNLCLYESFRKTLILIKNAEILGQTTIKIIHSFAKPEGNLSQERYQLFSDFSYLSTRIFSFYS